MRFRPNSLPDGYSMTRLLLPQFRKQIQGFGFSVRIFLAVNTLEGLILSMWMLFFNFYILALGFDRQFLGLIHSVTSGATLVFGLPMGILSDRIGRKRAMLAGIGVYALASILELLTTSPALLLCMAFLNGAGRMVFLLNAAPFLASSSKPDQRTFLFSLNFGLVILAGVIGNLFASRLAVCFAAWAQFSAAGVAVYRSTLLCAASLNLPALVLLALIRAPGISDREVPTERITPSGVSPWSSIKAVFSQPVIRQLALVQVIFGFGVAVLNPYLNIYFDGKFQISPQTLGVLFSLKSLFTGLAAFGLPRLVRRSGSRIRIAVFAQVMGGLSRLVLGFSPNLGLAAGAFIIGGVFLTTPMPLIEAFSMEQVKDRQRATLVSIRELSWQFSWGIGPYLSGGLQEHSGFSPVFVFSFAATCLASALNQVFLGKKEKDNRSYNEPQRA